MKNSILIIGGTKSGKSSHALKIGQDFLQQGNHGKGLFIATATAGDEEMAERIQRHREERGKEWETIEEPIHVTKIIKQNANDFDVVLIDCLTLWLSNLMFKSIDTDSYIKDLSNAISCVTTPVLLVSNETGMGIVPSDPIARKFRDLSGNMNQYLAKSCGKVILMTAGIALQIKPEHKVHFNHEN